MVTTGDTFTRTLHPYVIPLYGVLAMAHVDCDTDWGHGKLLSVIEVIVAHHRCVSHL